MSAITAPAGITPEPGVPCVVAEARTLEREQRDAARQLAQTERRRAAAAKGQLTKMRNKVARGECPMAGCGESFSDLHAHVTEQHPELSEVLIDA